MYVSSNKGCLDTKQEDGQEIILSLGAKGKVDAWDVDEPGEVDSGDMYEPGEAWLSGKLT